MFKSLLHLNCTHHLSMQIAFSGNGCSVLISDAVKLYELVKIFSFVHYFSALNI